MIEQIEKQSSTVALFVTCLVDLFRPEVGEATVALLERQGFQVEFPLEQTCCGAPALHSGLPAEAANLARRWVEVFEPFQVVVSPSAACVAMVRREYPRLLADDPNWRVRAEKLAGRTYELSEFLVDVLGVSDVGAVFAGKVAYQPACHLLRLLAIDRQPKALLEAVKEADVVELPDAEACCGFGGAFSVNADTAAISGAMAERKARAVEASQAGVVVTCETGCLLQLAGVLSRRKSDCRAMHLAELLAGEFSHF